MSTIAAIGRFSCLSLGVVACLAAVIPVSRAEPMTAESIQRGLVFVYPSRQEIPSFPADLSGGWTPLAEGLDFWGGQFKSVGTLRVFQGETMWAKLHEFPASQNGCGNGLFVLRWRSMNPDVTLESGLGFGGTSNALISSTREGQYGLVTGSNCHNPVFRFKRALNGNSSTLVDILYEVRFWRVAV